MSEGDRYVRRTRNPGPATWFDVRDGYEAGLRDGLLRAADYLQSLANKEQAPKLSWLMTRLREMAREADE